MEDDYGKENLSFCKKNLRLQCPGYHVVMSMQNLGEDGFGGIIVSYEKRSYEIEIE